MNYRFQSMRVQQNVLSLIPSHNIPYTGQGTTPHLMKAAEMLLQCLLIWRCSVHFFLKVVMPFMNTLLHLTRLEDISSKDLPHNM